MGFSLGLFASPTDNTPVAQLGGRVQGLEFGTNAHGFADLHGFAPMPRAEAFRLYDEPGTPHVVLGWNGLVVYEGRLEDRRIRRGGIELGALGCWSALYDAPYTALWSSTSVADFFSPDGGRHSAYTEMERFYADQNNRLFVGLIKGNAYTLNKACGWVLGAPDGGQKQIVTFSLDYEFKASANCTFRVVSFDWSTGTFVNGAVENSIVGNAAVQSGSLSITLAGAQDLAGIDLIASTAHTYAGETSAEYLRVTNVRIKTTTATTVRGGSIISEMAIFLNSLNPSQIQTADAFILNTQLDLTDELYQDEWPGDIAARLAGLGDNQTPPRTWEVGVWEDRRIHFQPRGFTGRTWSVDVPSPDVERTLALLRNSAYGIYQEAGGRTLRTAVSADSDSVARWALTRRGAVGAQTTSLTQAQIHRDAFLEDNKDPKPRAGIVVDKLYDAAGARYPNWMARASDTVTIRNLPPTLSTDIDRIRTFLVSATRYKAKRMELVPEAPTPSLETLIARQAAGLKRQSLPQGGNGRRGF